MLDFFNPNLNQQTELVQGHTEGISAAMTCHDRAGKQL